jgi:hypothetical protein
MAAETAAGGMTGIRGFGCTTRSTSQGSAPGIWDATNVSGSYRATTPDYSSPCNSRLPLPGPSAPGQARLSHSTSPHKTQPLSSASRQTTCTIIPFWGTPFCFGQEYHPEASWLHPTKECRRLPLFRSPKDRKCTYVWNMWIYVERRTARLKDE